MILRAIGRLPVQFSEPESVYPVPSKLNICKVQIYRYFNDILTIHGYCSHGTSNVYKHYCGLNIQSLRLVNNLRIEQID